MNRIKTLVSGIILGTALLSTGLWAEEPKIMVYKSPTCGCCTKWVTHLKENGFEVETTDLKDLRMVKSMSGIKLSSSRSAGTSQNNPPVAIQLPESASPVRQRFNRTRQPSRYPHLPPRSRS